MGKQKGRSEDRLAIVRYVDLCESDYLDTNSCYTTKLILMETYGYVSQEEDLIRVLKIKDVYNLGNNNQVMTIPVSCVDKIIYLKEEK